MIEKRRSKIQGWGVYATQPIPKNKRIIDYAGEKITNQESLKRERRYIQRGHIWCFKLTNRSVIDAGVDDAAVGQLEAPDVAALDVSALPLEALLIGNLLAGIINDAF